MRVLFSQETLNEAAHSTAFYMSMSLHIRLHETNSDCLKREPDNALLTVEHTAQLELCAMWVQA